MTNIELITKALIEITVIGETQTPSAEQGQDALTKLNQMMESWEVLDGIKLGWHEQTDISETAPLPPYAERGVTLSLALALASSYGGAASVTPTLIAEGQSHYNAILRKACLDNLVERRSDNMPRAEGGVSTFNIQTG